jgi:hypothetical protein
MSNNKNITIFPEITIKDQSIKNLCLPHIKKKNHRYRTPNVGNEDM